MKTIEKKAIASIRTHLGLRRLSPSRLFAVDDGVDFWIGDRADLTTKTARILSDVGAATEAEYELACRECPCVCSAQGNGDCDFDYLPESWRDGSALGPIAPL